jgi:hypothetical protein
MQKRFMSFALSILSLFAPAVALAQVDRATLNGTVTDSFGALVQNVKIELDSPATGLHRETTTNSHGTYQVPALQIGTYKITMSKEGFKPEVLEAVEFQVGQARTIDARLQVGARTEVVEVNALEALDRSSAEVGSVIESEQIKEIPLDGRDWSGLMALAPGAINNGSGDQQHSIRFNGRSLDDENYSFDGIDASGVQEQAQKSDAHLNISLESIAEFRVSSAVYTAESGAAGGAQINLVSKTGSNKFHGGAFEFLRNDIFDAKTYFDSEPLPPLRMNQFGGDLGGPIFKNRTFFYTNYEGLRQSIGDTQSAAYVPNAAARALVIATSPVLAPLVNAFPKGVAPYAADPQWTDQTLPYGTDRTREDYGMARIDHKFNDSTSAYIRGNIDNAHLDQPADSAGARTLTDIVPENIVFALQKVFSPQLTNEAKFGVNRSAWRPIVNGSAPLGLSVGGDVPWSGLTGSSAQEENGTTFSEVDNLTRLHGRSSYKFGIEIRRIQLNNSGNFLTTSDISYTSFSNFQNNLADSMDLDIAQGIVGLRRTFYMGYAQDEVKLTPNLTLNAGLRYEFYTVMHEVQGRSVTVSAACGGFCPEGGPFYQPNYKDFGPRIGLSWAPSALKGKTVVRTGFGIYYGANQNDDFSDPTESLAPRYSASTNLPLLQLYYGYDLTKTSALGSSTSAKAIDPNRKDLYYENWDFNIQQQLPYSFVAQVGYVGSGGRHLFSKVTANGFQPETTVRPIPSLGTYGLKGNRANSNFNALQVSLQRTFKNGFLWQTQYMWSHAITDNSIGAGEAVSVQNNSCISCDRSSTNQDVRHTFTTNAIYQLPFGPGRRFLHDGTVGKIAGGWDLSGIMSARSGLPVNITITRKGNVMQDGITSGQRPDLIPGVALYPAGGSTLSNWFSFAPFAVPAKYTWGNEPRYFGRGPGNYEVDTALSKRTALFESGGLTFRAEAFNLFNHPMFANPSGGLGSVTQDPGTGQITKVNSSFGTITSILNTGATGTGTPRRLQLSLRLDF